MNTVESLVSLLNHFAPVLSAVQSRRLHSSAGSEGCETGPYFSDLAG
jgi:hypothetical protein